MVKRPVRAGVRRAGGGAIVEIEGERGLVGIGEACPLPGRSRETLDESISAIEHALTSLAWDADEPTSAVVAALGSFELPSSARFALETALFSLFAAERAVPIPELLGGPRSYRDVSVNALLRLGAETSTRGFVEAARAELDAGFAALKLKLPSGSDDATFERARGLLIELRSALPAVELRLDVNAAWSMGEAARRLPRLVELALRYVEQPVAPADVTALADSPVPWAADESLEDAEVDAARLLATGPCVAFVLKPALAGGLLRARALAEIAISAGADAVITHALDGPVGLAAARALALSLSRPPLACGLAPHRGLASWERADG